MMLVWLAMAIASTGLAQSNDQTFKPPPVRGMRNQPRADQAVDDAASKYGNKREASVAALRAANRAAHTQSGVERTVNLLLIAAQRDHDFAKPVYDLGIMSARAERWEDAIRFHQEAIRIEPEGEIAKLSNAELTRLQLVSSLEATKEGKLRRQYSVEFLSAWSLRKDPGAAMAAVTRLKSIDPSRWETPAFAGILQAASGNFADSLRSFETAGRLAPPNRRDALGRAAAEAGRQNRFKELSDQGGDAWEKKDFAAAAKSYAEAWDGAPEHTDIGMLAAVGYLLTDADNVTPAIEVLGKLRQSAPTDESEKATAMLRKLAAIDTRAKEMADAPRVDATRRPPAIADLVGDLTSNEMRLAAAPEPPLLDDSLQFIQVPDDDLTADRLSIASTEGLFDQYQRLIPPPPPADPASSSDPAIPSDVANAVPAESASQVVPKAAHPGPLTPLGVLPPQAPPSPESVLVGNGVTTPVLLHKVEAEYSEEARRAKFSGTVLLEVVVAATGRVADARVIRSLGLGLDEEAVKAVKQWEFTPGQKDGKPVAVSVKIEVNFATGSSPKPPPPLN